MTARLDFKGATACRQGATFTCPIWLADGVTYAAQNLTGFTAEMMVKADYSDALSALHLTTENGGIVLGIAAGPVPTKSSAIAPVVWAPSVGGILITASAALTALVAVAECGRKSPPSQDYVYDFVLRGGGQVIRKFEGVFEVVRGVTI